MKSASKAIIQNTNGEFLLQKRDADHSYTGMWSLFGGHIDEGETPEQALVRELQEELGIVVEDYSLLKTTEVTSFGMVNWFTVSINKTIEELILGEGDEARYFSAEEIQSNSIELTPATKEILLEYITGVQ